jgi:hypothetical protein
MIWLGSSIVPLGEDVVLSRCTVIHGVVCSAHIISGDSICQEGNLREQKNGFPTMTRRRCGRLTAHVIVPSWSTPAMSSSWHASHYLLTLPLAD